MAEDVIALVAPLILDGLWGTLISRIFTVSILFLALFFPLLSMIPGFKTNSKSFVFDHVPVLLTSIGLFGTFVGIAVGLASFDVANVDKSLPQLLNGMKLAFWTSILGMACALAYKLFQVMIGFFRKHEEYRGVTANDIYAVMQEQQKMLALQEGLLNAIKNNINDKDTGSLAAQLQAFKEEAANAMKTGRESMELHLKEIAEQYRLFTENMTKNNTDAVVEALKEVIRDFNAKINEQFGENFKELNQAVRQLVTWQNNYKEHLEMLEGRYENISKKTDTVSAALEKIADSTQAIPSTMESFRELMKVLDTELKASAHLLETFVSMRRDAENVFPTIQQNIEQLTQVFSDNVIKSTAAIKETTENQLHVFEEITTRYSALAQQHDAVVKESVQRIETIFELALASVTKEIHGKIPVFESKLQDIIEVFMQSIDRNMQISEQSLVRQEKQFEGVSKRYEELALSQEALMQKSIQNIEMIFEKAFANVIEGVKSKISDFDSVVNRIVEEIAQMVKKNSQESEYILKKQEEIFEGLSKRYTDLALRHQSLLQQSVEKIESMFADTFSSISDEMKEKFDEFDKMMETEMSNAITRLGRQMASIAQKLVDDNSRIVDQYSGLAKQLASIPVPFEKTGSD